MSREQRTIRPATPNPESLVTAATSIRQLIANGKSKVALDNAKELHKALRSGASEELLIEAYAARIRSLIDVRMPAEAKALIELVRERYPTSRARLEELIAAVAAQAGTLDELLAPLTDPALGPEQRAAIEGAVERDLWDLAALAGSKALPEDHPLRTAAFALHKAFEAVTAGPVTDEAVALTQVSHRSPLASWKTLVRAIASFYRREDDACRRYLDALKPHCAAAKAAPALRAMLGDAGPAPLTAAAATLVSTVVEHPERVRGSLSSLDNAFDSDPDSAILKKIRSAIADCQLHAPSLLKRLQQHIAVLCVIDELAPAKVRDAMGGNPVQDAYYYRLLARGYEDVELEAPKACLCWSQFVNKAVQERWFKAVGPEAAAVYMHMAEVIQEFPEPGRRHGMGPAEKISEETWFLDAGSLFARACSVDARSENFAKWLEWAKGQRPASLADSVAEKWRAVHPSDIEPVLYLMQVKEKRKAFPTALTLLAEAERLDGLNPVVRKARFRLTARNAMRQVAKKKFREAEALVIELSEMPEARQGDRVAIVPALRQLICTERMEIARAQTHGIETTQALGSPAAANILMVAFAIEAGRGDKARAEFLTLASSTHAGLCEAIARVAALTAELKIRMELPRRWLADAENQFSQSRKSLDEKQLRLLGAFVAEVGEHSFAYSISTEGLARGGHGAPRFLLLRAQCFSGDQFERGLVCVSAVAELARHNRDMELVDYAVEALQGPLNATGIQLTHEQALSVMERETAAPSIRSRPPDYDDLLPEMECMCPDCRARRGDDPGFEDDEDDPFGSDEEDFLRDIPPDMPPEIARMLFAETKKAIERGESLEELLARLSVNFPQMRQKGKRR